MFSGLLPRCSLITGEIRLLRKILFTQPTVPCRSYIVVLSSLSLSRSLTLEVISDATENKRKKEKEETQKVLAARKTESTTMEEIHDDPDGRFERGTRILSSRLSLFPSIEHSIGSLVFFGVVYVIIVSSPLLSPPLFRHPSPVIAAPVEKWSGGCNRAEFGERVGTRAEARDGHKGAS